MSFWKELLKNKKPFLALAPMHDVSDVAFRQVVLLCSKPDVLFTEFVSIDGLSNYKSSKKITEFYLKHLPNEKPIVAQIWGTDPDKMLTSAKIIQDLGFDGIDINAGCPDKAVIKSGSGAALINTPNLMKELVLSAKEGASKIPVSIKTRLGFDEINIDKWLSTILEANPDAITIHARTKKELSQVPAHWNVIKDISKEIKSRGVVFIGNGDIKTYSQAIEYADKYNTDGIMIGRGALGNPWIFNKEIKDASSKDRINIAIKHAKIFEEMFVGIKKFPHVKKHLHAYLHGFDGSKQLRSAIMNTKSAKEVEQICNTWLKNNS